MKRRRFVKNGLSGIGIALLPISLRNFLQKAGQYPYLSLPEAFQAINFDPSDKGSSFFVVTADVHYGTDGDGMLATVKEVNAMQPGPDFFCVNGDLINSGSLYFGNVPDADQRRKAIREFKDFKADADRLHPAIPLKLTLGNHDTYPEEVNPQMFWEVFPGYPPYQSFDLQDIHIVMLNGHSTGYIDATQLRWLKKDVENTPQGKTVIIFVHQPSMSHRVRERGIPAAISESFMAHKGDVWLIGGHEHHNLQKVFQLNSTKLIEHHITCGTINIWGGPEKPGYWIYCLKDGKVAGRIFRQRFKGYRHQFMPDLTQAEQVPVPFDHLKDIRWKVMVGTGDRDFRIQVQAGDCLNYWSYVKELIYRIPLSAVDNACKTFAVLATVKAEHLQNKGQYFFSSDLKTWQEVELQNDNNALYDVLLFTIPGQYLHKNNVFFKYTPTQNDVVVGGFALVAEGPEGAITQPTAAF
jgi:hypothetical protein